MTYIKSPLNYIGGKHKIINQLLELFPQKINNFVDLFAGGLNVSINVKSNRIIANDNLTPLVSLYGALRDNDISMTLKYIDETVSKFDLSLTNEGGYKALRNQYNTTKYPLDLLVLCAYSFNHQIRFNSKKEFNCPFGKNRSQYNKNIKNNLIAFVKNLQKIDINITDSCFDIIDLSHLSSEDLVYCDPPYLITTGTYNDGKRGFTGWSQKEEKKLLSLLSYLNNRGVKFALSNVLEHKGRKNDILLQWLNDNPSFMINRISNDFSNSNYQTLFSETDRTVEVLITNYVTINNEQLSREYVESVLARAL